MKIESITIQNYGALWGSHTFSFDRRGLVLVLGENLDEPRMKSNGAAKSTIFDALDWCLFGKIPREDHVDSIVNEEAKGNLKVQTNLIDDDGSPLRVIRWRGVKGHEVKPNGVGFWIGANDQTALDDDETQARIERALGLDREVFHALVLHAQTDTWNFAAATDAERIKVLTKVLQLGQIDEWLERAKQAGVVAQQAVQKEQSELDRLSARLAETTRTDFRPQIAEWDAQHVQKIRGLREEAERWVQEHHKAQAELPNRSVIEAQLCELEARAPARPVYPPAPQAPARPPAPVQPVRPRAPEAPGKEAYQAALLQAHDAIVKGSTELEVRRREKDQRLRDATDFAQRNQGVCGLCRQPINPEHVASEVARLRAEATRIVAEMVPITATLEQWQDYERINREKMAAVDREYAEVLVRYRAELTGIDQAYAAELARYNEGVAQLDRQHAAGVEAHRVEVQRINDDYQRRGMEYSSERARLQGALTTIAQREREVARLYQSAELAKQQFEQANGEKNPWIAKQVEVDHRTADLEQAVHYTESEVAKHNESLRYVEFWIKALGPKGLKNFIMDSKVQELTDAANHWMRLIFGGTAWVRFETQVQGRSTGKLANSMNIRCFRYMPDGSVRERNFKSLSGGEKQRTSLAIDMGLSRIIASRATKRYDLLVLDEVFKHLDSAGREAVVDLLFQLQTEKSSIFVVDHDAEFQGAFEHRVVVRKQGGRSTILEGAVAHDQDVAGRIPQEAGQAVQKTVPRRRPVSRTPVTRRAGS